jgi:hypothetical protein
MQSAHGTSVEIPVSHRLSHHKLRVVVHCDVDPGQIRLDVSGCLTRSTFPALVHLLLRAHRLVASPAISLDLRRAIHLDAGVLAHLRRVATPGRRPTGHVDVLQGLGRVAAAALEEAKDLRLTLMEPVYMPVCPVHSGSQFEAASRDAAEASVVEHPSQPTDPASPVRPSRAASAKRAQRERSNKAVHLHL